MRELVVVWAAALGLLLAFHETSHFFRGDSLAVSFFHVVTNIANVFELVERGLMERSFGAGAFVMRARALRFVIYDTVRLLDVMKKAILRLQKLKLICVAGLAAIQETLVFPFLGLDLSLGGERREHRCRIHSTLHIQVLL